ncbi:MAG TPA: glycosyltransferase family 1 protein [Flavobacterium sp.]|uniref:glycosyltransferase family 4 protein n=1 Tax=Flavobacterium sp. TaxID=239 RepID=UPI002BDEFC50|nr:glycosyltransferase family 1 protein [Flavobacterium sp.]HSD15415.1 glycosyltransferase family 1 protein [Flavobacterium sp.]
MKIILDPQTFNEQKFGGISRYYTELYLAYQKEKDVTINCPVVFSDNLHLKEANLFQNTFASFMTSSFFPKFIRKKIHKNYRKANIKATLKAIKAQDFDVFVPTYFNPYFVDTLGNKPFVLTVYDMIHEKLPQYFQRDTKTSEQKKLLMEKATRIIAISESTKKDILEIYPHIDAAKIDIVYLSHSIEANSSASLSLPKDYILFVGNRSGYKNFIFFIKAVADLLKADKDLFVVCAGGNKFSKEEEKLIAELGIANQILQRNFEDNELASYYRNAKCFVFPSEYEGFGIPVLESMACGCPIVLAHHSSFPEVAGDAGVYFELNNTADLKNKVQALLSDENLRRKYAEKGIEQASKFSWKVTAQHCLEVYKKVVINE